LLDSLLQEPITSHLACSRPITARLVRHSTLKLRENKEVGGTEREVAGASNLLKEDATDDGSGAWLPSRPLPLRN